jgi:hypothetical protein
LAARSRCKNARGSSSGLPLRTTCRRRQTGYQWYLPPPQIRGCTER